MMTPAFSNSWRFAWRRRAIRCTLPSQPSWLGCTFTIKSLDTPLYLEPHGMSKGQIYLNGSNLGRYFVSTHAGKAVGPHNKCLVPASWLREQEPNELILFDEYGRSPSRCKLVPAE